MVAELLRVASVVLVFLGVFSVSFGQLLRVWNFPVYSVVFLANEFQRRCIKKKSSLLCLTRPGTPQPPFFSPPPSRSRFHVGTLSPKTKRPIAGAEGVLRSYSMAAAQPQTRDGPQGEAMKLLFVEMGVGYDQHGQDITVAAVRACKDAISSNSIPAFRRGSIPGVNSEQMKLQIKLGVPRLVQHLLDFERIKAVFPYGEITSCEVVDGGMICSSGTCIEAMGDKNDDCYIVNAAVYVGY